MFTCTGCIDFVEELFLNKDGSGKYIFSYDMSKMMDKDGMAAMFKNMANEGKEEEAEEGEDTGEEVNAEPVVMDSVVYFKDVPGMKEKFADNPGFLDKVTMHINMDELNKKFLMSFKFDFDNVSEIDYFYNNVDKLMDDDGSGEPNPMDGMFPESAKVKGLFSLKGKTFTRKQVPLFVKQEKSEEDESNAEMMRMMFASGSYKMIYHLPGNVKKASNKEAEIGDDGKTVIMKIPILDYLEEKVPMGNKMKWK